MEGRLLSKLYRDISNAYSVFLQNVWLVLWVGWYGAASGYGPLYSPPTPNVTPNHLGDQHPGVVNVDENEDSAHHGHERGYGAGTVGQPPVGSNRPPRGHQIPQDRKYKDE